MIELINDQDSPRTSLQAARMSIYIAEGIYVSGDEVIWGETY